MLKSLCVLGNSLFVNFLGFDAVANSIQNKRISQAGGGALEGIEGDLPGQYTVNQFQIETVFNLNGFSWTGEYHRKEIVNNTNSELTNLGGFYLQASFSPHSIASFFSKKLEIAKRYARYRLNIKKNNQTELAFSLNWFFNWRKNELTAEITRFTF